MIRIAHREPRFLHMVRIFTDALGLFRLEIERIWTDQQRRHRAALHRKSGANVVKSSVAGAQLVARIIGFHVLRQVVELHVSARQHHLRIGIVFNVIRAQSGILVADVHVPIRIRNPADLFLLVRLDRGFASAGGKPERRLWAALTRCHRAKCKNCKKQRGNPA